MVVAEPKNLSNFKAKIDSTLKERFDVMIGDKRISLKDALEGMIEALLAQDDELCQSMLLGQIKPRADLIEHVLRRLATIKRSRPGKRSKKRQKDAPLRILLDPT